MGLARAAFLAVAGASLSGCIVVPLGGLFRESSLEETTLIRAEGTFTRARVAVIDISGFLRVEEEGGFLRSRPGTVYEVRAALRRAAADARVKAIVLRIDSPGGGVTASDILNREIRRWKDETKRPVVACIVDVGASGGYYVACAADEIIAHPTAVTGSIGVIMQTFDLSGLLAKIGVKSEAIKSGEKKDLASIWREMSAEERAILQGIVARMYERFIDVVAKGRKLAPEKVGALADGRVFTADEAKEAGLIDRTGYMEDAVARAKILAAIDDARVIRYTRGGGRADLYAHLGGAIEPAASTRVSMEIPSTLEARGPFFLYYWAPGLGGR
ncbi:MAG: signal peptide peptidase SppA [Planctomycetes bacterium]|nr:signal peptide peptidase SppA [Planctomycetota bacterium]